MNILLITVDALRADHLNFLGYNRGNTLRLDEFSHQGIVFKQVIAQSSHTPESFPAILASIWPLSLEKSPYLSEETITMTEVLKQKGYTTGAFHSNPYLSRAFSYDKGFDFFDDDLYLGPSKLSAFLKRATNYLKSRPHLTGEEINKRAITWLQNNGASKFFLWLHYMDPHGPYQPPKEYLTEFGVPKRISYRFMHKLWRRAKENPASITKEEQELLINLYDAEIEYVDSQIGDLIKELKEMNLFENTFVVITSDHGEAFGEHGRYDHPRQLYEENIHVPLVAICPALLPQEKVVEEQVRHLDLAPTILDLLDCSLPEDERNSMQGESFAPLCLGDSEEEKDPVVISETSGVKGESDVVKFSVRTKDFKLIVSFRQGKEIPIKEELYDLQEDPKETKNLAKTKQDVTELLRAHLERHIQELYGHNWKFPKQQEIPNKEVEDRLRSLGYLD